MAVVTLYFVVALIHMDVDVGVGSIIWPQPHFCFTIPFLVTSYGRQLIVYQEKVFVMISLWAMDLVNRSVASRR